MVLRTSILFIEPSSLLFLLFLLPLLPLPGRDDDDDDDDNDDDYVPSQLCTLPITRIKKKNTATTPHYKL